MASQTNAEMASYWNGEGGDKWVDFEKRLEQGLKPFGTRAIELAAVQPGEQVLEIGCGCGPNTIELASRLGAEGHIVGVDISEKVLASARLNIADKGLRNVEFNCADAQTGDLGSQRFDLGFSRFGVMFFDDPQTAFKNIGRALAPGGRIVFASWAALEKNDWVARPLSIVAKHIPLPPRPAPGTPGPFSLSDETLIQDLFNGAGLESVTIEAFRTPMNLGKDVDEAVTFLMQMSPSGAAVRLAEPEVEVQKAIAADLGELLAPHATGKGVFMEAEAVISRAQKPGNKS